LFSPPPLIYAIYAIFADRADIYADTISHTLRHYAYYAYIGAASYDEHLRYDDTLYCWYDGHFAMPYAAYAITPFIIIITPFDASP